MSQSKIASPDKPVVHRKTYWKRICENWQMYVFLLLPLIWILIFKYAPMYGAQIAFKDYKPKLGITGSPWTSMNGFKWFVKFFSSYMFKRTVGNTIYLSLYSMIVGFPIPILFALLINSATNRRWRSVLENVTYMPYFISTVVMVSILVQVFDINSGVISSIVKIFTGHRMELNVFQGGQNFRNLYVWSGVWQGTGWGSIIYVAALSAVDPEQHEAAKIDGASRWARVWYIDFPAIIPTIAIMLILRCGSVMSIGFDKAFLMQNDTNTNASEVISTYVYKVGLASGGTNNFSFSAAIGFFNSVVNLIVLTLVNTISNKVSGSGLW
ncbi:MAG: ABC transporter permease subunit [Clostridiaceae bacterium]|nr:ABC transporter permease subunit [Clostridiaceae bacterium]